MNSRRRASLADLLQHALFSADGPDDADDAFADDELHPAVVWALLDQLGVYDERGWDGTAGLPATPWERPITRNEFLVRLAHCQDVHRTPRRVHDTGFVVGRKILGPKPWPGGDWRQSYWDGQRLPRGLSRISTGGWSPDIQAAALFRSRAGALRALLRALPAEHAPATLEALNYACIIGCTTRPA